MKFEIGQNVSYIGDGRYPVDREYTIEGLEENYGLLNHTLYQLSSVGGNQLFAFAEELELIEPTLKIIGPQLSRQEKTQIAIELLDTKLFSVADAIEMLESLEDSITTPQEAEDKEVREIMLCLDSPNFPTRFHALIHVLVSNGTLTLKQVERALGSDNV